jgi:hypothetical protein
MLCHPAEGPEPVFPGAAREALCEKNRDAIEVRISD